MIATGHCEISKEKGIGNSKLRSIIHFRPLYSIGRAYRHIT